MIEGSGVCEICGGPSSYEWRSKFGGAAAGCYNAKLCRGHYDGATSADELARDIRAARKSRGEIVNHKNQVVKERIYTCSCGNQTPYPIVLSHEAAKNYRCRTCKALSSVFGG